MLLAGDVETHILAVALAVAHLAKDSAVRGEDALDGVHGAVGVGGDVHGGIAVRSRSSWP